MMATTRAGIALGWRQLTGCEGSRNKARPRIAPIQLLHELARRDALVPVLLQGLALGLVVVVDDEAARGGSVELVVDGLMLGVLEVSSQVVRRPETDEEPVGVVPASPAEVLADGEVHDVRNAAPQVTYA